MNLNCIICALDFPIADFRALRCGHCHCKTCTAKFKINHNPKNFRWKAECPQCRMRIKDDDISLFFTISDPVDAAEKQMTRSIQLLGGLDSGSGVEDVASVGDYLATVTHNILKEKAGLSEKHVEKLLRAVALFKERMVPSLMLVKEQTAKIKTLQAKLGPLENSEEYFRTQVDAFRCAERKAVDLAQQASNETIALRAKLKRCEEQKILDTEKIQKLEEENRRLKGNCEAFKSNESITRVKIKGLRGELKRSKEALAALQSVDNIEDSLQIGDHSQYYDLDMVAPSDDIDKENDDYRFDFQRTQDEQPPTSATRHRQPQPILVRTSTSTNRNFLAHHPSAPIMQDDLDAELDIGGDFVAYRSDWNLQNPNPKKRKLGRELGGEKSKSNSNSKPPFPLILESGRAKGVVHVGPRLRMGKRG